MQDRLKINEKSKNQFQNVLMRIRRLRVKQGQKTNISETKKLKNILKDVFKNKIKNIKKGWSIKKCTCKCKKRKRLFEKGLKKQQKCRIFHKINLIQLR